MCRISISRAANPRVPTAVPCVAIGSFKSLSRALHRLARRQNPAGTRKDPQPRLPAAG
jgi:hypothetical protein